MQRTSVALMGYGVGLVGLVAIKVLAPGYYAKHDMRTPMLIAVGVLVLTQLLNVVLVPLLQHAALTLTIGIGALVNAIWLLVGLIRRGSYKPEPGWGRFVLQVLAGALVLGALAGLGRPALRLDRPARRAPAAHRPAGGADRGRGAALFRGARRRRRQVAQFCARAEQRDAVRCRLDAPRALLYKAT